MTQNTIEIDQDLLMQREAQVAQESDREILDRMRDKFQIMEDMTHAVKSGDVRAMIVMGGPGIGKSFGVEKVLGQELLMDTLADRLPRYEIVKGSMSSIGLYCKLYQHQQEGHVIVMDDADGIYNDEDSLNLLKGALDSGERRVISWNKDSRILRSEGIPDRFDFKGSVIFITNLNFNFVRSKKLRAHLNALESRCHVIDLGMDTIREKFLRIHQVVGDGMLDRYDFGDTGNLEILKFMQDHAMNLREISLRMVIKVANLRRAFPNGWQKMARTTCMTR
jgi:hypothetical protein